MCDIKKYTDIYNEIIKLNSNDTLQLVLDAPTEDEREFFELVGDFLLQKKQKEVMMEQIY